MCAAEASATTPWAARALEPAVQAARLEELVRALCTVETAGREATSEGYMVAARLVAAELERLGLVPAGDEGYFQRVPIARWTPPVDEESGAMRLPTLVVKALR